MVVKVCFIDFAVGFLGDKISNTEYGGNVFFRDIIFPPGGRELCQITIMIYPYAPLLDGRLIFVGEINFS